MVLSLRYWNTLPAVDKFTEPELARIDREFYTRLNTRHDPSPSILKVFALEFVQQEKFLRFLTENRHN